MLIRVADQYNETRIALRISRGHALDDRTYVQRPIRIIPTPANNLIFVYKNTSNGYFVGGKSLLCLSHSVRFPSYLVHFRPSIPYQGQLAYILDASGQAKTHPPVAIQLGIYQPP